MRDPNPAWWPTDYCDEIMPAGRAGPSDWIVAGADCPMLAPLEDGETPERVLRDGDVVRFTSCVIHDEIALTLTAASHFFERPPPAAFDQCCCLMGLQFETLADSAEAMIAMLRDATGPGDYLASFYTYDDGAPWRFVAATRSFEKATTQ